jgi:hypothetical protein
VETLVKRVGPMNSNVPLRFSEPWGAMRIVRLHKRLWKEGKMRTLILIGLLIAPLPALGQTFELGPGGFRVYPHGGGNCRELRAACMHKEELGESGQGNCQRYRELCLSGARGYYHHRRAYEE